MWYTPRPEKYTWTYIHTYIHKHDKFVEVNLPWCYHCYLVDKYWQMSLCRQRAHYDLCFVGGSLDLASKLSHPSQMHKNHAWNISIVSNSSDGFTNFMKLKVSEFHNVFWVSSFRPKNQRNFFQDFCPSL